MSEHVKKETVPEPLTQESQNKCNNRPYGCLTYGSRASDVKEVVCTCPPCPRFIYALPPFHYHVTPFGRVRGAPLWEITHSCESCGNLYECELGKSCGHCGECIIKTERLCRPCRRKRGGIEEEEEKEGATETIAEEIANIEAFKSRTRRGSGRKGRHPRKRKQVIDLEAVDTGRLLNFEIYLILRI